MLVIFNSLLSYLFFRVIHNSKNKHKICRIAYLQDTGGCNEF